MLHITESPQVNIWIGIFNDNIIWTLYCWRKFKSEHLSWHKQMNKNTILQKKLCNINRRRRATFQWLIDHHQLLHAHKPTVRCESNLPWAQNITGPNVYSVEFQQDGAPPHHPVQVRTMHHFRKDGLVQEGLPFQLWITFWGYKKPRVLATTDWRTANSAR